jgi:hypothetical protein
MWLGQGEIRDTYGILVEKATECPLGEVYEGDQRVAIKCILEKKAVCMRIG